MRRAGQVLIPLVDQHNTILMPNLGVVSWSHNNVVDACFKMEILEACCRTILVTAQVFNALCPPRRCSVGYDSEAEAAMKAIADQFTAQAK